MKMWYFCKCLEMKTAANFLSKDKKMFSFSKTKKVKQLKNIKKIKIVVLYVNVSMLIWYLLGMFLWNRYFCICEFIQNLILSVWPQSWNFVYMSQNKHSSLSRAAVCSCAAFSPPWSTTNVFWDSDSDQPCSGSVLQTVIRLDESKTHLGWWNTESSAYSRCSSITS